MKEATSSYKTIKTIYPYLGVNCEDYWHINYEFRDFSQNFDYYWNLKKKYEDFEGNYDEYHVPLYLGSDGIEYYSSIFLGHYAIGAYQKFIDDNDLIAKNDFILIANWFVDNLNENGLWINEYPMKTFNLESNWHSGLSQAKGVSTLTRAFYLTHDIKYLNAAVNAIKPYTRTVLDDGIQVINKERIFFEEYTTINPSSVLNGHIFAIWSLRDMIEAFKINKIENTDQKTILNLYELVLSDLSKSLYLWDTGRWSRYDIWPEHYNITSLFYHDLHIKQLNILYRLTQNNIFHEYELKWRKYRENPILRILSLAEKIKFRLVK
ncbi:D-glucuronyl C5-epimerase family protein [Photobacterium kishitanii]|uniref:D-glucuronyl C5-epimerase family protein n=1 Tax=Photobacterium kishitanii TaxID=318456 RepID=UPI0015E73DB0|nr:D-glucuronyl C5-epimerase family protein [Photobacterium kishitanii]